MIRRSDGKRGLPRYFLVTLLVFWLPVLFLRGALWNRLPDTDRRAFWRTTLLLTFLTTVMEAIYLTTRIWTFSEDIDPLLGLRVFGVPVEEYSFWFGATPFMLLTYLFFSKKNSTEATPCPKPWPVR